MSDDFFSGLLSSIKSGWETGSKVSAVGPSATQSRSRPSFWNPFKTWRDEEREQLLDLYNRVSELFENSPFMSQDLLEEIIDQVGTQACERAGYVPSGAFLLAMDDSLAELIGSEYFWFPVLSEEDINIKFDIEQAHLLKKYLEQKERFFDDNEALILLGCDKLAYIFSVVLKKLPRMARSSYDTTSTHNKSASSQSFEIYLSSILDEPAEVIEYITRHFFDKDIQDAGLFNSMREQLEHNVCIASGINKNNPKHATRPFIMPTENKHTSTAELVDIYLSCTAFDAFFNASVPFNIYEATRFEHTHIIGGTGHGKTQLLQQLIYYDLKKAAKQNLSLIVIDSQSDLINKLSRLKEFDQEIDKSLSDRLLIIDPSDIDHPPALNLFDGGLERLDSYSPYQRELAFNSLVDIYGRFFGTLLGSELTSKQGAVFRFLARLMLTIDGATIHTLIELMDDIKPFNHHINKLDPTAKRFFEKEFSRGGFNATRQQIKQRLYAVLSIPTFDRLFSAPKSKVNFFDALNEGKIILVNTAKDLLKSDGAAIFGRFILSLVEHAVMERATLKEHQRTPTFLYVDEAQDYFDETIETMLVEGRKKNFGIILAHQNLAQLSPRLKAVLMGNTTIKLAGGITVNDAKAIAPDMRTTSDMLLSMTKQEGTTDFALSVRNHTPHALRVNIPLGFLEEQDTLENQQYKELLARNRERICYDPTSIPQPYEEARRSIKREDEVTKQAQPHVIPTGSQGPQPKHRDQQNQIAAHAKSRGFTARIEYALMNDKRIDIALFGHSIRVALEVSVTNREQYELANIKKALDAEFDFIWMISADHDHLQRLEQHARKYLSVEEEARVLFGAMDKAIKWLDRFEPSQHNTSQIAGYEIESIFVPPESVSDLQYRRDQLRRSLI